MSEDTHKHHNHSEEEFEEIDSFDALDKMTLFLDDGTEIETGVLGIFELATDDEKQQSYIALLTREEEVLLYRYQEINEDEIDLDLIETKEEHELVKTAFEELFLDGESLEEVE